ncbi:MAG: helix-turn-helix transcriptional regulator [Opitutaceae bacterium]
MIPDAEVHVFHKALEALAVLQTNPAGLGLFAVETTDWDGLDYIPEILGGGRVSRVIIVSGRMDLRTLRGLRDTRFSGFLDATTANEIELRHAISEVVAGRRYLGRGIAEAFQQCKARCGWDFLTPREQLCLSVLAAGHNDEQAGDILGRSTDSIRGYRGRITRNLGLEQRSELIVFGEAHNFVRFGPQRILHPGFERELERLGRMRDGWLMPAPPCVTPFRFAPGCSRSSDPRRDGA